MNDNRNNDRASDKIHESEIGVKMSDEILRRKAAAREPLIAKWAPEIPVGYIHVDDAIDYIKRRWGPAVRTDVLESFLHVHKGPLPMIIPSVDGRKECYYAFDAIDLWVYRTLSGVPASWRETLGKGSMVRTRDFNSLSVKERTRLIRHFPHLGEASKSGDHE